MAGRTHKRLQWLAAACFLALGWLSWARYSAVHQRTFDLALYARVAWGMAHGDFWSPVLNTHAFGAHISPVLWALGVLGRLTGNTVAILLTVQAACAAACIWPMARLGERHLGRFGGWLGAIGWLLFPNIWHVTTYEFHPGNLAVLPLCWAAEALDRGALKPMAYALVAACLCREDMGIIGAVYGVAFIWRHGRSLGAFALLAGLGLYTSGAVAVTLAHAPAQGSLDQHFGVWGGSPLGVIPALWSQPEVVWAHFTTSERLLYVPKVLAPVLLLSLRVPWLALPALPTLALNLISAFPTTEQFYSHYLTPAVPALVASSIVALERNRVLTPGWLLALLVGHVMAGGSPISRDFELAAFRRDGITHAARRVLGVVHSEQSVQAPDALLPHLAERKVVHRGPPPDAGADWVVLDASHRDRFRGEATLLRTTEEPIVRRWLSRTDHTVVLHAHPFIVLKRGAAPRSGWVRKRLSVGRENRATQRLTECLAVEDAQLGDQLTLRMRALGPCPGDLALRIGPRAGSPRVQLLFDGGFSPVHLRAGDSWLERVRINKQQRAEMERDGVWVGAIRRQGAPPAKTDPVGVRVR